jgi:tRNA modification GTPase
VDKARALLKRADIVLDLGADLQEKDIRSDAACLRVSTKADLMSEAQRDAALRASAVLTSATSGQGVNELMALLVETAGRFRLQEAADIGVVLNDRHVHKLRRMESDLVSLLDVARNDGAGDDVLATLLSSSLAGLGELTGRVFTETLLGEIFSRLCVGK